MLNLMQWLIVEAKESSPKKDTREDHIQHIQSTQGEGCLLKAKRKRLQKKSNQPIPKM